MSTTVRDIQFNRHRPRGDVDRLGDARHGARVTLSERRVTAPRVRIACLQTSPGNDFDANLATLAAMTREAAGGGAQFVLSAEYALMMDGSGRTMRDKALAPDGEPALSACRTKLTRHASKERRL